MLLMIHVLSQHFNKNTKLRYKNKKALSNILTYHVVSGKITATDVVAGTHGVHGGGNLFGRPGERALGHQLGEQTVDPAVLECFRGEPGERGDAEGNGGQTGVSLGDEGKPIIENT